MYTCGICGSNSKPGQPRVTHVIYRTVSAGRGSPERTEIEKEIPICMDCKRRLHYGSTYEGLSEIYTTPPTQDAPKPQSPPPPSPKINEMVRIGKPIPNHHNR